MVRYRISKSTSPKPKSPVFFFVALHFAENAMIRQRQLFLFSRLELAAEFEQILGKDIGYRRETRGVRIVLMCICLPSILLYAAVYAITLSVYHKSAAEQVLPHNLLRSATGRSMDGDDDDEDGEQEDNYQCRVLDLEKRTKTLLTKNLGPVRREIGLLTEIVGELKDEIAELKLKQTKSVLLQL